MGLHRGPFPAVPVPVPAPDPDPDSGPDLHDATAPIPLSPSLTPRSLPRLSQSPATVPCISSNQNASRLKDTAP